MDMNNPRYDEQAAIWDGPAGRAWVAEQQLLDRAFKGLEDLLVEQVFEGAGGDVLDVGCGTGSTTLAIADTLGPKGSCVGIDVSGPMLAAARARADRHGHHVSFINADAESYRFEPAAFDMVVSRFGVMFFKDPERAFSNLRNAARPGADLRMLAWRSAGENAFMTTAERAAAPVIGGVPGRPIEGPGQFAFADPAHVRKILNAAGWEGITLRRVDVPCRFPREKLIDWVTKLGPLGRILVETDDASRSRVLDAVLPAFSIYGDQTEVRFTAACWLISAMAGSSGRDTENG